MVSIGRARPGMSHAPRQVCTCTSAKHHMVKMATLAMLECSTSSTLTSSKSKVWKYFGFQVDRQQTHREAVPKVVLVVPSVPHYKLY